MANLTQQLIRHEGLRLKPYRDTEGKLTVGVGRNLDDRGISESEALYLLANDIAIAEKDLDRNAPWWRQLSGPRRQALLNMVFNLGWPRLSGFRSMLAALQTGDYEVAAKEMLDSKWAAQVGNRAKELAGMVRSG
ncbi:MAG TPA: glycoside hydrolase family protein [Salinarimonas sp.]|nr:glycoside hydrolase family protein [Salinarimonas sp.]